MGNAKSKDQAKQKVKTQISDFNERLQIALVGCNQAKNTFTTLSDMWSTNRQDVVTTLDNVADKLDRYRYNVNIAKLTGNSSSIAGGTAALASLLLGPFSGGASLALTAGGLFGTLAGQATTLGANVVEVLLTKEEMGKAKTVLDLDAMYTKSLSAAFRELVIHENDVIAILAELQDEALTGNLTKIARFVPFTEDVKTRLSQFRDGVHTLEDVLALVSYLYKDDEEFLRQLKHTDTLFKSTPTLSTSVSTSSEFFQALKELSLIGPETMKAICGTALQSSSASVVQVGSLSTQMILFGFGAVFVALDVYNLVTTCQNYDEGSKSDLGEKLRSAIGDLQKEQEQVQHLCRFYKKQTNRNATITCR